MVASCRLVNLIYGLERPTPADEKREADREQFQKGFPGCRFRGATVIADASPAEQTGFEPSVPQARHLLKKHTGLLRVAVSAPVR